MLVTIRLLQLWLILDFILASTEGKQTGRVREKEMTIIEHFLLLQDLFYLRRATIAELTIDIESMRNDMTIYP